MPTIDIISFKPSEEPKTSSALQNFLESLRGYSGVISTWHGFQVEEPTQYHIAVVWDSFDQLAAASQDAYYPSLPATLPIESGSSLQRELFDLNRNPEVALAGPITDMTYMFLKDDKTFERDLKPLLMKFEGIVETGAKGTSSGQSIKVQGMSAVFVGWDTVEQHYGARKIPAYAETIESSISAVTFTVKHVAFQRIF